MKRLFRTIILILGALVLLTACVWFFALRGLVVGSDLEVTTHQFTRQELEGQFDDLSQGVRILAGFSATRYGGFHGDGGSLQVYLIDPADSDLLLEGLRHYHTSQRQEHPSHYDYEWSTASRPDLSGLRDLLPDEFLPPSGTYSVGRATNRRHSISIESSKGFVCFSTSRT